MKIGFAIALIIGTTIHALAQEANQSLSTEDGAYVTFIEESHDFGDIVQGDVVKYTFNFENTGNEPLILSNVLTTCGCTATQWPRDPIAPGKKGSIDVQFNSTGKMGRQNKVVTVVSNAANNQARVRIVSNVLPPDRN
ncbi:MAG: DUF1573 domain-containing protein [Bacteroidota bacterium]